MTFSQMSTRSRHFQRIQLCAGLVKWLVSAFILALIVMTMVRVLSVLSLDVAAFTGREAVWIGDTRRSIADLSLAQRGALAAVILITFAVLTGSVWTLRNVCSRFQNGELFSPGTLRTIVSLGVWLISYAIFEVFRDPFRSLILTLDFPKGQRTIDVTVDGGEIFCMILGALLLLFGWIMREAALLAEENEKII